MCLLCTSRGVSTGRGSLFRARGVYGGYGQGRLEKIAALRRCFLPKHLGVEDSRNAPGVGVYLALLLEEVVGWFMPPLDGAPVVIAGFREKSRAWNFPGPLLQKQLVSAAEDQFILYSQTSLVTSLNRCSSEWLSLCLQS